MRDILFRVGLLKSGLMTETEIQVLIIDAMASSNTHLLPPEVLTLAAKWLKTGKLTRPQASVN